MTRQSTRPPRPAVPGTGTDPSSAVPRTLTGEDRLLWEIDTTYYLFLEHLKCEGDHYE